MKLCVLLEGIGVYLGMIGHKQDSASSNCVNKYIRNQLSQVLKHISHINMNLVNDLAPHKSHPSESGSTWARNLHMEPLVTCIISLDHGNLQCHNILRTQERGYIKS